MQDQVVLITGGASGIGRAIAEECVRKGAGTIILLDLDAAGLARTAQELGSANVETFVVDIADPNALSTTFSTISKQHGTLDQVYNSAGIQAGLPAWPDAPHDRIRAVIEVNLIGLMLITQAAIPLMKKQGGTILNVASISGLNPYLSGAVYGASKAGVIHFTKCNEPLAAEFGIRVNALCPAMVDTPFLTKTGIDGKIADWLKDRLNEGNVLSARDVALAAIRLAADKSKAGQIEVLEPSARA